ncbi:MAG: MOSC domain-containing protein [Lentisphaerae bacterium]|nr:MAG: MOSC domain-containing protein [Lentisphaerota bacterium]
MNSSHHIPEPLQGTITSLNISREKGTTKEPVPQVTVNELGIVGDAHAGPWHRQVSILAAEAIEYFATKHDRQFKPGEFAENITVRGFDLKLARVPDQFLSGDVRLELTQIGKACHGDGCAIYQQVGKCVMPREGLFTRVLSPGTISVGDTITWIPTALPIHVITLSDRASRGEYEDRSGPLLLKKLKDFGEHSHWRFSFHHTIIPDDPEKLRQTILDACNQHAAAIFTTGGTGIGPRDITPETVTPLLDRQLPGIMELIRVQTAASNPKAALSRGVAGTIGQTLIYTLPGSLRAIEEYTGIILPSLAHAMQMIRGYDTH